MKNAITLYSNNAVFIRDLFHRVSINSKRFSRKIKGGSKMLKSLVLGIIIFVLFGLLAGIWGVLDKIRLMLEREMWRLNVHFKDITYMLSQNKSPYTIAKTFDGTVDVAEIIKKEYNEMKEGNENGRN